MSTTAKQALVLAVGGLVIIAVILDRSSSTP